MSTWLLSLINDNFSGGYVLIHQLKQKVILSFLSNSIVQLLIISLVGFIFVGMEKCLAIPIIRKKLDIPFLILLLF